MPHSYAEEDTLGHAMFGHAQLGDKRRNRRLVESFNRMHRHPGGTLPEKMQSPADLKALYRLFDCPQVTHAALVQAMRAYTRCRILKHGGPVLVLHDATELDYSTLTSIASDLGQIGKGNRCGYICQNVLAVAADTGEVLGLLDQILHCRDEVPKGETLAEHRDRPTRESLLWLMGTAHLPADMELIDVVDQGGSTFEFLEHECRSGRSFIVRNGKQRKVYAGHEGETEKEYLLEHVKSQPELGRFTMDVQPQKGRKGRKSAEFAVRCCAIRLLPPHARHGHHGRDPLPMYVVYVEEISAPPKGEKPLSWLLLTNVPAKTFKDAWRVLEHYECRWVIEVSQPQCPSSVSLYQLAA